MGHIDMHPEDRHRQDHGTGLVVLMVVCCLPLVLIALGLSATGGLGAGFAIPSLAAGALLGLLMFITVSDSSRL